VASPRLPGSSTWTFLQGFLREPRRVGAIAPTSTGLARRMAARAGAGRARAVAELGAGTGVITRELLRALPDDGRLWAFEIHPPFVEHLRATIDDPRLTVVAQSAATIGEVAAGAGLPGFDAVVSALPFSLFGAEQTAALVHAARLALRPGGRFVALQYRPTYLPPFLRAEFGSVAREIYPWNLPPALVLRARAPRAAPPPRSAPA
jgi:phosphatidylethanolamine/phosphatidyl-N-methylethanolamine N-methyltransferase